MKRVIIITQGLSRIVKPLVCTNRCVVVGIIECAPRNHLFKSKNIDVLYKKIKRYSNKSLEGFSKSKDIPYYYMTKSSEELGSWIKNNEPDIIVVFSMSQLLKENIYSIPKYGTINLHPSLLPKYRGPNPSFWSYYNMDTEGGVTVHFIDKGEDTGDIIYQEVYDIPLGIKSPERLDIAISQIGVALLLKAIKNIESIKPIQQPKNSPTKRARNLKLEEHKTIIDWRNWSVERVWHVLRGTELWLNAIQKPKRSYIGTQWIIGDFEKKVVNEKWNLGQVYKRNKKHFVVCKDGIIYLSPKLTAKAFILSLIKNMINY